MLRRGTALFSWLGVGAIILAVGCNGCSKTQSGGKSLVQQVEEIKKEPDASVRATKFTKLALRQFKFGDREGAEQVIGMAADECKKVEDMMMKAEAWGSLANAQATLDNRAGARRSMEEARKAVDQIKEKEIKAENLIKLAGAQAKIKDLDGASETLQAVEKLAAELKDGEGKEDFTARTLVLDKAALAYHKAGVAPEAERLITENFERAKAIEDPKSQGDSLADVAMTQNDLGQKDTAAKTLDMALEAVRKIDEKEAAYSKALTLASTAEKYAKLGNAAKAREVFTEAEQTTNKIPDVDIQQTSLQDIRAMADKLKK